MTLAPPLALMLGLLGQAAPPSDAKGAEAAARLAYMKRSMAAYEVRPADNPNIVFKLQPEPVMRFVNTVGASRDGAIFLWHDDAGRPAAAAQVMVLRGGVWVHELTSLSTVPLVGRAPGMPDWAPDRGGVTFKAVPGAPKPADTPEKRLAQMRALARDFAAEDHFRTESWQKLRLLTKPFARYGKPGSGVTDGALFAFVLTTDPEVYLMLEARPGKDGPAWHYAFAPMTVYAVRGFWKGEPVWDMGLRFGNPPSATFHNRDVPHEPAAPGAPGEPSPNGLDLTTQPRRPDER